jgi:hypothetical protein
VRCCPTYCTSRFADEVSSSPAVIIDQPAEGSGDELQQAAAEPASDVVENTVEVSAVRGDQAVQLEKIEGGGGGFRRIN